MNLMFSRQKDWQPEKLFLFTPTRTGARHADDGMAGHKGVRYRPVDSSKMGIAEAHQSKSPREGELLSCTRSCSHTYRETCNCFASLAPVFH